MRCGRVRGVENATNRITAKVRSVCYGAGVRNIVSVKQGGAMPQVGTRNAELQASPDLQSRNTNFNCRRDCGAELSLLPSRLLPALTDGRDRVKA